jgi:hypothetical protein
MQRALGIAGFLDRVDFRPEVIRAQVVVGDAQAPGRILPEQAVTAVAPEIRQG